MKIINSAKAPASKKRALPANWQAFIDTLKAHCWEISGTWDTNQPFFLTCSAKEAAKIKLICRENKIAIETSNEDLGFVINPR